MERDKALSDDREYTNGEITVYWKPGACVHASYCYRDLIQVFDPSRRPWVDMKGAPTEKIIETVNMCPTEALTWKWNNEEKNVDVGSDQCNHVKFRRPELIVKPADMTRGIPVSVKVMIDGPVIIKGNFSMVYGDKRKEIRDSLISICRCGATERQPFCDGTHRKKGFIG